MIDIEAIEGTVVLSGKVATFHQKQLATALAGKVAGVVEVMNHLEVDDGWKDGKPAATHRLVPAASRGLEKPTPRLS